MCGCSVHTLAHPCECFHVFCEHSRIATHLTHSCAHSPSLLHVLISPSIACLCLEALPPCYVMFRPCFSSSYIFPWSLLDCHLWWDSQRRTDLKTKMLLQVHDELVFEVPHSELEHVRGELKKVVLPFLCALGRYVKSFCRLPTGFLRCDA